MTNVFLLIYSYKFSSMSRQRKTINRHNLDILSKTVFFFIIIIVIKNFIVTYYHAYAYCLVMICKSELIQGPPKIMPPNFISL